MSQKVKFKLILTDLNLGFSFFQTGYHTGVKEPSLPHYSIVELIPFSRVLALCEMEIASSRL